MEENKLEIQVSNDIINIDELKFSIRKLVEYTEFNRAELEENTLILSQLEGLDDEDITPSMWQSLTSAKQSVTRITNKINKLRLEATKHIKEPADNIIKTVNSFLSESNKGLDLFKKQQKKREQNIKIDIKPIDEIKEKVILIKIGENKNKITSIIPVKFVSFDQFENLKKEKDIINSDSPVYCECVLIDFESNLYI